MADDKILQTYPSPEDARWIELRQRPDGRFYFQEFSEAPDDVPEYGAQSNAMPGMRSGTYESFEAAESDLQKMFPWLCENPSKEIGRQGESESQDQSEIGVDG